MTTSPLTPAEQRILRIESEKFRNQGNKERRIYKAAPELITALRIKRADG